MNGRIYDAKLGRFLQADPLIQNPYSTQSLNRYSYTNNNPLNAVDPSGFSFFKKLLAIVISVVITVATYGAASGVGGWAAGWGFGAGTLGNAVVSGAVAGALGGFASGLISTGTLSGAFTGAAFGALSGAAFGAVGHSFGKLNVGIGNGIRAGKNLYLSTANFVKLVASQALTGGVMSVIQGGKFGHGFISAGFAKFASPVALAAAQINDYMGGAVSAVVGGTASAVTGGKFANGASTGAIMYAANALGSAIDESRRDNLNYRKLIRLLKDLQTQNTRQVFIDAGFSSEDIRKFELYNACSTRLSMAINDSGDPISAGNGFKPNGENIITSVNEMASYLTKAYGSPDIEWTGETYTDLETRIGNKQGILIFTSDTGGPAENHATAWERGSAESIDGYGSVSHDHVRFWEFK